MKNAGHPYRQALDEDFDGRVRVFDIADFTHLRPHDLRDHCCIVVGTLQTLRVKSTEGRKVYAHHEEMEPHFSGGQDATPGLERLDGGGVKFSFANLLHIHRPLMIVDEAHNAVTGLTREMQARVNPCAIIEFTATPRPKSNILYSVTAQELKREDMIKLPIMLSEHDTWQNAVNGAIAKRASLTEAAKQDADYLRPIVLLQAQKKGQEVTVDALKKHLMDVENISESAIAVATGDQRELDGIDLFDRACPIEYVITVEALKEGWDCSFAYVFCSVSRIHSATDVEQLLGRVLRMPYAKRRRAADLNRRMLICPNPPRVRLRGRWPISSWRWVLRKTRHTTALSRYRESWAAKSVFSGRATSPRPSSGIRFTATPAIVSALKQTQRDGVTVHETGDGTVEIEIVGPVDAALEKVIRAAVPEVEHGRIDESFGEYRKLLSPAERGEQFTCRASCRNSRESWSLPIPTCSWKITIGRCSAMRRTWTRVNLRFGRPRAALRSTLTAGTSPISSPARKNNSR